MANHDLYEKNLLKALQDITKSLRSIDSTLKTVDKDKEKTESDTPILSLNNSYKSILRLDRKLTCQNIPHELVRLFDGWQICYPNANNKIFDVVEHYRSYGHETDQMEAYGYGIDDVKGCLDADEVFELLQNVHTERLHKKEVAKASRELDPIVYGDYILQHRKRGKGGEREVGKSLCHDCMHNCTDRRNNICANHKGIWCNAEYGRVINKKVKGCKSYVRKENKIYESRL